MRRALPFVLLAVVLIGGADKGAAHPPAVKLRVLRFVDATRRAHFRNGTSGPRVLVTSVRYPSTGRAPFPLVVFAHGFMETPSVYARQLDTWARAGYVVAAPIFPVERLGAPGGSDESDLGNEPGDLSFVISRLTAAASPLRAPIDPTRIAVAGQSDGAEAALSAAYDSRYRDRRIKAALVMSGAAFPGFTGPPAGAPPLLAVQGTSDPFNAPATTSNYFRLMRRPKFLLWLVGAAHLEPYTTNDRWAAVVRDTTTAFLNRYLRGARLRPLVTAGTKSGVTHVDAEP